MSLEPPTFAPEADRSTGAPRVDARRLLDRLARLRRIGAGHGISRIGFSAEEQEGRALIADFMAEAGLRPEVDPAGNLIGLPPALRSGTPVLMLGSHIDTVPEGGAYDGALGVLGAIEVVQTLSELGLRTHRPLADGPLHR